MPTAAAAQTRASAAPLDSILSGIEAIVSSAMRAAQSISSDVIPLVQSGQRLAVIARGIHEQGGAGDSRAGDGGRRGDDLLSQLLQGRLTEIPIQTDVGASPSAYALVLLAGATAAGVTLLARR